MAGAFSLIGAQIDVCADGSFNGKPEESVSRDCCVVDADAFGLPLKAFEPRGKMRTRQHVLADLGVNYLEWHVLLCGYTVHRVQSDYGYDLVLTTYRQMGEIEPGAVYIQVKATES